MDMFPEAAKTNESTGDNEEGTQEVGGRCEYALGERFHGRTRYIYLKIEQFVEKWDGIESARQRWKPLP